MNRHTIKKIITLGDKKFVDSKKWQAIRIGLQLESKGKYNEAIQFYRKVLANPRKSVISKKLCYSRIADILIKQRKYKTSLKYLFICLKLERFYRKPQDAPLREMGRSNSLIKIGEVYLELKQYKKAKEYFDKYMKEYKPFIKFPHGKKLPTKKQYDKVSNYLKLLDSKSPTKWAQTLKAENI